MRLDLIEVKTEKKRIKIIPILILAFIFIVCFSLLGMHYAKLYKTKLMDRKIKERGIASQEQLINQEQKEKEGEQRNELLVPLETQQEENNNNNQLLPVYSENAKKEMKNIYKNKSKIAYLTFDDGPSQAVTPFILDLLKQENIKATFFVLGSQVKKNPELLKREYLEGHYIANHGYTHNYAKIYRTTQTVLNEYTKTEKEIQNAIGNKNYSSHLFRFPGGYAGGKYASVQKAAGKVLNTNNISYIDWNVLTGDAEGANTKEKIMKNIKKYVKNKGTIVVLMHDASSKILTYETLKDVIDYLRNQGYTFNNFYSIMQ